MSSASNSFIFLYNFSLKIKSFSLKNASAAISDISIPITRCPRLASHRRSYAFPQKGTRTEHVLSSGVQCVFNDALPCSWCQPIRSSSHLFFHSSSNFQAPAM